MLITDEIQAILAAPTSSAWLKQALESALERDPADAANDAERLADLLDRRFYANVAQLQGS
ncbi:hypothetical protein [Aquipseudomonas alcaligenes]|uniref:Uncharacterized protein n=1 Tax=Aquipseudomonas alcaligenes TaxID=43263 RepID=A0A1N6XAM4_AQUAC|nr:hypothetical protein [Pseudomonas alcaligenes]SIQ99327.1 hypothetical protein SAMN05878282_11256 [Pseudomonas alcaligenes]